MDIFSRKELAMIEEMIVIESILKVENTNTDAFTDAFRKWHSYPEKLKNSRRKHLGVI